MYLKNLDARRYSAEMGSERYIVVFPYFLPSNRDNPMIDSATLRAFTPTMYLPPPILKPVHDIEMEKAIKKGETVITQSPLDL